MDLSTFFCSHFLFFRIESPNSTECFVEKKARSTLRGKRVHQRAKPKPRSINLVTMKNEIDFIGVTRSPYVEPEKPVEC